MRKTAVAFDWIGHAEPARTDGSVRLPFRADIEGLRAVAILLVVCAHAKVPGLAGGFVGVDVFFVLSGFLITGLLVHEIRHTGSVAFAKFYSRRFLRLLPSLMLMLVCSMAAASIFLAPYEQAEQASGAATAAIWISNIQFAFDKIDYFGDKAESSLFLHTWSLGVEEQFYLVWPCVLLVIAWFARRRRDSGKAADSMRTAMAGIVLLGFVASVILTYTDQRMAFYLMPGRCWQFALGALVFLEFGASGYLTIKRRPRWPGWLGFAAIAASAVALDGSYRYPGIVAMLPSLGTAVVLATGNANAGKGDAATFLSMPALQFVGRRSYAWYLWHWPVLLLGSAYFATPSRLQVAALVIISFALASLSNAFLEVPMRDSAGLRSRPHLVLLGGVMLMLGAVLVAMQWYRWAEVRSSMEDQMHAMRVQKNRPRTYGMGCDDWYHSSRVRLCEFGSRKAKHVVVLMGDSISAQWLPALSRIYNHPGWKLVVVTKSACPMVDEPFVYFRINRPYIECTLWRAKATAVVRRMEPDVLLISSHFDYPFNAEQWERGTEKVLGKLTGNGAKTRIGLLRSTSKLPFNGVACVARRHWRHQDEEPELCSAEWPTSEEVEVGNALSKAVAAFPGVHFLDLNPEICRDHRCTAEEAGEIVFRDDKHISVEFMRMLTVNIWSHLRAAGLAPGDPPSDLPAAAIGSPKTAN
jgi:peptidoglycan/LPS O-acetylase OafA/YrhL